MSAHIGILGLGSMGMRHAGNLLAAGARVRGFDPDAGRRAALEAKGGAVTDSHDAVLDGVDGVIIASPSAYHLDDLAAVAGAGLHAFVEKPLAHRIDGIEDILGQAERSGLTVFAGLNMRFHPVVEAARALLADGAMGTPLWGRLVAASYLPDWRPHQDYREGYAADAATGGAIFDFIHEFDLAVHLLGPALVVAASAHSTGRLEIASEDTADAILTHQCGATSTIHVDYVTRPRQRRVEIACTEGFLALDLERGLLSASGIDGGVIAERAFDVDPNQMFVSEIKNFLACIKGDAEPRCSGREAMEVLRVAISARELSGLPSA